MAKANKSTQAAINSLLDRLGGGDLTGPELISDTTESWANSEAVNSLKDIDIVAPAVRSVDGKYLVIVVNPSTETALLVTPKAAFTDGATPRKAPIVGAAFTVAIGTTEGDAVVVTGLFVGATARLTLDNTTVIGPAGAFTARVQVWRF